MCVFFNVRKMVLHHPVYELYKVYNMAQISIKQSSSSSNSFVGSRSRLAEFWSTAAAIFRKCNFAHAHRSHSLSRALTRSTLALDTSIYLRLSWQVSIISRYEMVAILLP